MSETIFSKIIAGEIPCHKVYEDDTTLAFLDINPVQPGHTLVIPKTAAASVWDLDPTVYSALMGTTQKVAQRLRSVLAVPFVGEKIVGVDVAHAHVHLIPFSTVADYDARPANDEPDHASLSAMANKLAF
ncbi:MAG: HIT domain-containing protein [Patescibacteria group bacterium]|nr:HIT domain-containing protein [Patescibacteria group bacterium]